MLHLVMRPVIIRHRPEAHVVHGFFNQPLTICRTCRRRGCICLVFSLLFPTQNVSSNIPGGKLVSELVWDHRGYRFQSAYFYECGNEIAQPRG